MNRMIISKKQTSFWPLPATHAGSITPNPEGSCRNLEEPAELSQAWTMIPIIFDFGQGPAF